MTGKQVRQKIKERGFTFHRIALSIGESDANLQNILNASDVKSGALERIAAAMGVNVAYFYNEQPIFTLVDYVEFESSKREQKLLHQIIRDKEALIEELKKK